MNRQETIETLAPCGLDCGRCLSNPEGPIARAARDLKEHLGGFAAVAPRFAGYDPAFSQYDAFDALLSRLAFDGGCTGCRNAGQCLLGSCLVKDCVREKGVDFCFQCGDFPCGSHGLPPLLQKRWRKNNEDMRDLGLEDFFTRARAAPRY